MESIFKNKKIIIGIVVIIIAFFVYAVLFVSGDSEDTGGLKRQAVSTSAGGAVGDASGLEDGSAKEFVSQLLAIQNVTFKMSLFEDPVFKNMHMVDNTIQPQPQGRRNPFLPFEVVDGIITPSTQDLGGVPPAQDATSKPNVTPPAPKTKRTR
jgi:hypothetical protein